MTISDFTGLLTAFAICLTALVGLANLLQSRANGAKMQLTHDLVDGQTTKLLAAVTGQAHAEGVIAGTQSQRDRDAPAPTEAPLPVAIVPAADPLPVSVADPKGPS